jgi:O-antigen ligase
VRGSTYLPKVVVGATAVAFLVFGSRWGSHLGSSPLFLTDVLLAVGIGQYAIWRLTSPTQPQVGMRPRSVLLMALVVWSTVRWLAGGQFDVVALRDAAPYLYAIVGVVAGGSVARLARGQRDRTARLLTWALGLHVAWTALATVAPAAVANLPVVSAEQGLRVFSIRSDHDMALNGVFAGWLVVIVMSRERRGLALLAFLGTWGVILSDASRAGLISASVTTVLAFLSTRAARQEGHSRQVEVLVLAPVLVLIAALVLPQTIVGNRLAGTFNEAQTSQGQSAASTTEARQNAWSAVWDYVRKDDQRLMVGVGFGPDFLTDSGATLALVGTQEAGEAVPRSPHNYWLGTLARLGILGLGLVGAIALVGLRRSWKQLRRPATAEPLGTLVALIIPASIPIATLGVTLESPFGAVLFFWAAGVLGAYATAQRDIRTQPDTKVHSAL